MKPIVNNIRSRFNLFNSISSKLIASFLLVIFFISLVSFLPLVLYQKPVSHYDHILATTEKFKDIIKSIGEISSLANVYARVNSEGIKVKFNKEVQNLNENIAGITGEYELKVDKERINELDGSINNYISAVSRIFNGQSESQLADAENIKFSADKLSKEVTNVMLLEIELNNNFRIQTMQLMKRTNEVSAVAVIIAALISLLTALWVSRNISNPVKSISKVADKIAEGDVSGKVEDIRTNDEVKFLSDSFNRMIESLNNIIFNVRQTSEAIRRNSLRLSQGATESSAISEEIASSAGELAEGANNQSQIVEKLNTDIKKMYDILGNIADKSLIASTSAQEAMQVSDEGTKSGQKVISQMKNINNSMSNAIDVLNVLTNKSNEIGQIINLISNITEQTNLLSLNAAIEAARAGEHGRGFAVVADEIRKLSDGSSTATKQITEIIKSVQEITENLSKSMSRGVTEIKSGVSAVEDSVEVFNKLKKSNELLNSYVYENNDNIQNALNITGNIKSASADIVDISKTFTLSSEGVASASEQLAATLEETLATVNELNEVADKLKRLVEKFSIKSLSN